ncbi:replication licensing factor Cdt1 [Dinochytrium kinnereticum]|nr:replication licensing factor Cdt1 [Dinochytrium kinnereticum]
MRLWWGRGDSIKPVTEETSATRKERRTCFEVTSRAAGNGLRIGRVEVVGDEKAADDAVGDEGGLRVEAVGDEKDLTMGKTDALVDEKDSKTRKTDALTDENDSKTGKSDVKRFGQGGDEVTDGRILSGSDDGLKVCSLVVREGEMGSEGGDGGCLGGEFGIPTPTDSGNASRDGSPVEDEATSSLGGAMMEIPSRDLTVSSRTAERSFLERSAEVGSSDVELPPGTMTVHSKRRFDEFYESNLHMPGKTVVTSLQPTPTRTFATPHPRPTPLHKKYLPLLTSPQDLPLPPSHALLEKFFTSLEFTISFLNNKNLSAVFERLRKPVENMAKRSFGREQLERILAVMPDGYRVEACRSLGEDGGGVLVDSVCLTMRRLEGGGEEEYRPFGEELLKRRVEFRRRLVERVKVEHSKFLKTLPHKVKDDPEALTAWHSDFNLDAVPEVERVPLPKPRRPVSRLEAAIHRAREAKSMASGGPVDGKEKGDGGGRVFDDGGVEIEKERREGTMKEVVENDVVGTETQNLPGEEVKEVKVKKPDDVEPMEPLKKPLSRAAALIERIRLKEQKRKETEIYQPKLNSEEVRRMAMLSRLPHLGQAVAMKAMPLKEVGDHVVTAAKNPLSHAEACDHVRLLAEVCPDWCQVIKLTAGAVVRIEQVPARVQTLRERVCLDWCQVIKLTAGAVVRIEHVPA